MPINSLPDEEIWALTDAAQYANIAGGITHLPARTPPRCWCVLYVGLAILGCCAAMMPRLPIWVRFLGAPDAEPMTSAALADFAAAVFTPPRRRPITQLLQKGHARRRQDDAKCRARAGGASEALPSGG